MNNPYAFSAPEMSPAEIVVTAAKTILKSTIQIVDDQPVLRGNHMRALFALKAAQEQLETLKQSETPALAIARQVVNSYQAYREAADPKMAGEKVFSPENRARCNELAKAMLDQARNLQQSGRMKAWQPIILATAI